MKVIQVTPSLSRSGGRMFSETVRYLSQAIRSENGVSIEVIGLATENSAEDSAAWSPIPIHACKTFGPRRFGYAPQITSTLLEADTDIVHMHGLWTYLSIGTARWSGRTKRPYLVSPRGMLEPWALRRSGLRKRVLRSLFQDRCLRNAACIHATSDQEASSVRSAGFSNPIAVIPNGVEVPESIGTSQVTHHKSRTVLFLSRIHPKKGLLNLISAWSRVRPLDWQLNIVGPNQNNHREQVEAAVRDSGLSASVAFHGSAAGEEKRRFFEQADLFVLPSFSENFGQVIAEALSFGVPVITTRTTPWKELETRSCGWWIDVGVEPLVAALKHATELPAERLSEMGRRGRQLVRENYSWGRVADQLLDVYRWCVSGGVTPASIRLD